MDKAGVQIVCRKGKFLVLEPHTPYQATPSGDLFIIHKEFAGFQKAATCLYETSKWTWELGWLSLDCGSARLKVVRSFFHYLTRQPGRTQSILRMRKTVRVITADRTNDWPFSLYTKEMARVCPCKQFFNLIPRAFWNIFWITMACRVVRRLIEWEAVLIGLALVLNQYGCLWCTGETFIIKSLFSREWSVKKTDHAICWEWFIRWIAIPTNRARKITKVSCVINERGIMRK